MIQKALPENQLNNVIRWIKNENEVRLGQLNLAIRRTASRLGIRHNRRLSVKGIPAGSDQFDSGSVVEWLENVNMEDTEARQQVAVMLATVQARLVG